MARLPDPYARRPVGDGSRPIATIRNAGAVGDAVAGLGRSLQRASDDIFQVQEREREEESAAKAAELEVEAAKEYRRLLHDPEAGFLNTTGETAINARSKLFEELEAVNSRLLEGLPERTANRLKPVLFDRAERARQYADIHVSEQRRKWLETGRAAVIDSLGQDALVAARDEKVVLGSINAAIDVLRSSDTYQGLAPEARKAEEEKIAGGILKNVTLTLAMDNPASALEFAERHRARMGEATYLEMRAKLEPEAKKRQGRDMADAAMAGRAGQFVALLDRTEGAGDYRTLYGHAQRPGGAFAGVDITQMTIAEVSAFAAPDGRYASHVRDQVGRVATPMGRGQIVGTTLRAAAKEMGLSPDTKFTPAVQNAMILHLAEKRLASATTQEGKRAALRAEWEGLKHVSDAELDLAIMDLERGTGTDPLRAAQAIEDPDVRQAAMDRIEETYRVDAMLQQRDRQEAQQQVFAAVEGGMDPRDLPVSLRLAAGPETIRAMENWHDQKSAGFSTRTDPELFAELLTEMHTAPEMFAQRNLLSYRDKLSEQDYRALTENKAKIEAGAKAGGATYDEAHRVWRSLGIESGQPGTEVARHFAKLEIEYTREVEKFTEREKRQPYPAEQREIATMLGIGNPLEGMTQRTVDPDKVMFTESVSTLRTAAAPALLASGFKGTEEPGSDNARKVAAFHSAHADWANTFVAETGRQPTQAEAQKAAERMLRTFTVDGGWLSLSDDRRAFEFTDEDVQAIRSGDLALYFDGERIDARSLDVAARAIQAATGRIPTVEEVLDAVVAQ